MIALCIAVLAAAGVATILARRRLASLQAMLAGGTFPAGFVVAEGVVLLVLAALVAAAWKSGFLK